MNTREVKIELNGRSHEYYVKIGSDLLENCGSWAKECLPANTQKIALISNEKVFALYGGEVLNSLQTQGFEVFVWLMKDGEEYKSLKSLQESLSFFGKNNLKRSDAVVALGGGVVGDLSGFAASIYLRGIKFLQIPTTLLSMIDSSVGGKTAVNTEFGKNLVGTFYQPHGVLVDMKTLKTLEHRELIAGFCEAIKQGAIGDSELFDQTHLFIKQYDLINFPSLIDEDDFIKQLKNMLAKQIAFKAKIVMQDEQETVGRSDNKSRKILNFGHTTAHALEKITDYKYFKHGEAVGLGILVAGEIAKRLVICDIDSINLLNDVVHCVGELPNTDNINLDELLRLFLFDKKATVDSVEWILLTGIGEAKIVDSKDIPIAMIKDSLQKILHSNSN